MEQTILGARQFGTLEYGKCRENNKSHKDSHHHGPT